MNVTAIIPNYNYARFLKRRVDSILQQSYSISELIILDDCSTDNSKEVIKEIESNLAHGFPELKVRVVVNQINSGNVFKQWEKGINLANSPYIWICEADDLSEPAFLKTVMQGFEDKDVVFSFANSKIINQNGNYPFKANLRQRVLNQIREGNLFRTSFVLNGKEVIKESLAYYDTIPNVSALVFKKSKVVQAALKEAQDYRLSGDWIFYLVLAASGKVAYSRKALNLHRISNTSVTSSTSFEERLEEMKKIHTRAASLASLSDTQIKKMLHYEQKLSAKQRK